jgi:hypothetical protein
MLVIYTPIFCDSVVFALKMNAKQKIKKTNKPILKTSLLMTPPFSVKAKDLYQPSAIAPKKP